MKKYTFGELTLFIWDINNSLEALAKIEDYIFENVKQYTKNEIKCMLQMIEVKLDHVKNPLL